VYGQMQFADFVVCWALQALSRSLQKVGEYDRDAGLSGSGEQILRSSDAKALSQTAEQILSLWQMMQWSVGKVEYRQAKEDLRQIVELTTGRRLPERLAAGRLLERAAGKNARLLEQIMKVVVSEAAEPAAARERLGELLRAESGRWRGYALLRQAEESALIEHGILRAFGKAEKLSRKLDAIAEADGAAASARRLRRAARWTHHAVNHLELLRPALSESGRTRRWHLTRLAAKLDEQWALEKLARTTVVMDLRPKASARLGKLIRAQRVRLETQRRKLSVGAYAGGSEAYRGEVTEAVAELRLEQISLLPLESLHRSEKEIG
jgi:hypothetical protein